MAISFASALPVVGSAVSAVSKGTKLCRAGKLMARSLALTEKMVVAANKVDNLSRAISDPTGCFVAGTKVPTVDGYKNIEDIEVGDQVYSENPYTGEKGYKKVVETYVKEKHTIVYLKVNNETIETTNEHPFWVEEENAFVKAEDLEVGDTLRLRDGETVTLEGIESKTSEDITKVYNFQVADWHTYYVTDMDILVHNNCISPADGSKTNVFDTVEYGNKTSGLENHHGILNVWAKHNINGYKSRAKKAPTIALTKQQHNATKTIYRDWLFETTGKKVGGKVEWTNISARDIKSLSERMFDAANVPMSARNDYYRKFNQYIYGLEN